MNEHYVLKGINNEIKIFGLFSYHSLKISVFGIISVFVFYQFSEKGLTNLAILFLYSVFLFLIDHLYVNGKYLDEIVFSLLIFSIKSKIWV